MRWARGQWKLRYGHVISVPIRSYPSSFATAIACISTKEEYGENGPNTSAGYFGMVYPPASYPQPGPAYAARLGNSWLDIPLADQIEIAYAEEQAYGWSPWSTAGACGL